VKVKVIRHSFWELMWNLKWPYTWAQGILFLTPSNAALCKPSH